MARAQLRVPGIETKVQAPGINEGPWCKEKIHGTGTNEIPRVGAKVHSMNQPIQVILKLTHKIDKKRKASI